MKVTFLKSFVLLGSVLLLGACGLTIIGASAPSILKQEKVNLANASHASADILAHQSQKRFDREDNLLIVSDLVEDLDFSKNSLANPEIGKVIAGQMRTRFLTLGYNIFESTRTQGSKNPASVTGTYNIRGKRLNVYVRMTNTRTGEVLGVHEYSLPLSYDIKKYMARDKTTLPPIPHII